MESECPELLPERRHGGGQIGERIGSLEKVVDVRRVAQQLECEPAGGDDDGQPRLPLSQGFKDGSHVNAGSERKHVLKDEDALDRTAAEAGARNELPLDRQGDSSESCDHLLFRAHAVLSPWCMGLIIESGASPGLCYHPRNGMQIVQAVFGVFHHFELAHQMHRRGYLRKLYSTWPWARLKREGLPRELVGTFPLLHTADHVLGRTRFYPRRVSVAVNRWNAVLFDEYTRRVIPECDALIAISGAGLKTGKEVQRRGGRFICDRGSTHQRFQEELLRDEYRRWKVEMAPEPAHVGMREEEIYAAADAITVPSSVARRSFVARGIPAEKVHVIPYGVRLDRFAKTAEPPRESFEVLFAGQVSVRKGIPYLLEAFARLRHPAKRLTVVGAVQGHMRELLQRLPVTDVTFTGSMPQAELAARMSRSHVMVLPSVEEGLALVQAQAMACGCPVIATRATGAEDLFTDGVEGFIVDDRDVDALSARLQQVADDPALRERLSEAAQRRVQSVGGWEEYGSRWAELLGEVTGARLHPEAGS